MIAPDTRGHGKSPRGSAPFTIGQFAEDLNCFMECHGIHKADILGFSDGGNIALVFALKFPEKVDRLILNGANLNPGGVKAKIQIPIVLGYKIASLFAKKSPDAQANAEMLGLMVNEPNIPVEALRTVQAKTLVIAGTKDMIKEAHTRRIYRELPNAELVLIPGNHFIAGPEPGGLQSRGGGLFEHGIKHRRRARKLRLVRRGGYHAQNRSVRNCIADQITAAQIQNWREIAIFSQ